LRLSSQNQYKGVLGVITIDGGGGRAGVTSSGCAGLSGGTTFGGGGGTGVTTTGGGGGTGATVALLLSKLSAMVAEMIKSRVANTESDNKFFI
jgi:hypothetical protein